MSKNEIIQKLQEENVRLKNEIIIIQYAVYKCKEMVLNNKDLNPLSYGVQS